MVTNDFSDYIVLEVPHMGNPRCYSGYGRDTYLAVVYASAERSGAVVWEKTTARKLAEEFGLRAHDYVDAAKRKVRLDFIESDAGLVYNLAGAHGWDAPLYRADVLATAGEYQAEPIDELEAAQAWAGRDLSGYWLVTSAEECAWLLALLTGDAAPRVGKCGTRVAAAALRCEAVRVGWIAEPKGEDS